LRSFPSFLLFRILQYLTLLILIASASFLLVRYMPGSPLDYLGGEATDIPLILTEEAKEKLMEYYGLNKPITEQYLLYIKNVAFLDFGYSTYFSEPVRDVILPHLERTLVLVLIGLSISMSLAFPLSIFAARRRGKLPDILLTSTSLVLYSIPSFALAMLFLIFFSLKLKIFPLLGFSIESDLKSLLWHAMAPAIVFSIAEFGKMYYFTRNSFINILDEDYVLFARSKGLKERTILLRHVMRNALPPILSKAGLLLGYSLLSCMFVESVFNYPGITWLMLTAYDYYDFPVLQAIFLIVMASLVLMNALADIISMVIDPRMREGHIWS